MTTQDIDRKLGKLATLESRLPAGAVVAVALPIGLYAFAWTNSTSKHWTASIILSAPFGFRCVPGFISFLDYCIDSYTIYAASVLRASAMLRAYFGMAFPLFTSQPHERLGSHWSSSISGLFTIACLPFPFVMLRCGETLRLQCKYAQEAANLMTRVQYPMYC